MSYLPPHILPSIFWYLQGISNDYFLINTAGNFVKQTPCTRYTINGANGPQQIIIEINRNTKHNAFKDVQINYDMGIYKPQQRAIISNYKNAPFFEYYDYKIFPTLFKKYTFLLDLIIETTSAIQQIILPEITIQFTENIDMICLANDLQQKQIEPYMQVFDDKNPFNPNCSMLDAIFNLGPMLSDYLYAQ